MKTETENLRELDAWIFSEIFRYTRHKIDKTSDGNDIYERVYLPPDCLPTAPYDEIISKCKAFVPEYTTDPAAAMQVLEKCAEKLGSMEWIGISWDDGQWKVRIVHSPWEDFTDDTLPLAICRLAKALYSK